MRKAMTFLISFLFLSTLGLSSTFALDPVAPKSDRAFGYLKVDTPLPASDRCEIQRISGIGYQLQFQPGEMIKVPVGEYQLNVQLQNGLWSSPISVSPTEFTAVIVPGYGNLKVNSPNPRLDMVEVFSHNDGRLVDRFPAANIKTLPIGNYDVMIKVGNRYVMKDKVIRQVSTASRSNVSIMPNTTRELTVSF